MLKEAATEETIDFVVTFLSFFRVIFQTCLRHIYILCHWHGKKAQVRFSHNPERKGILKLILPHDYFKFFPNEMVGKTNSVLY